MTLRNLFPSVREVVHQNIVADVLGRRKERPTTVDFGELVNETLHIVVLAEHKRVNRNALARTALYHFERLQQGALGRGVFETNLTVQDMCGRLAIRNQNHLFVGGMLTRQELRGYL